MLGRRYSVRMNVRRGRKAEGSQTGRGRYAQRGDPWRGAQPDLFVNDVRAEGDGADDPGGPAPCFAHLMGRGLAGERPKDKAGDKVDDAKEHHSPHGSARHLRIRISG